MRNRIITLLLVSLLATSCARSKVTELSDPPIPAVKPPQKVEPQTPLIDYVPGVSNFGFISADVWRGAKPTEQGFRLLRAMGVQTVIDLQEVNEASAIPTGVRYVRLPVSSLKCDQVRVEEVLRAIDQSPKPVFIHCLEGRDRTGLAVAAYRLKQGMSAEDAIVEINSFHVNWWWKSQIEERVRLMAKEGRL